VSLRRIARCGAFGEELPVIIDADDRIHLLSQGFTDIDATFWASGPEKLISDFTRPPRSSRILLPTTPDSNEVRWGAPISRPNKIVCIGLNYRDHAEETGMASPEEPVVFMKPGYTVVGPNDDVWIPTGSTTTDYEVELGVVIGARTSMVTPAQAWSHIGGFVLTNDISERHWQFEHGSQWVKGKSFETFNPTGPWLVLRDDLPNPQALGLTLSVNGQRRQDGNTADMIFDISELVSYVSRFMVLEPGDLINTGTPAGVAFGNHPEQYLKSGDVVEASSPALGRQQFTCRPHPSGNARKVSVATNASTAVVAVERKQG